jgi:hypothetical protein
VGDLAAERGPVLVNDAMPVVSEAPVGIAIQPVALPPREPPSSRQFRSFGENCPVCFETLDADGTTLLQCGHLYHASCLLGLTPRRCPECRSPDIPTLSVLSATVQRLWDRLRLVSGTLKETEEKLEETTGRLEETTKKMEEILKVRALERAEYMAKNRAIADTCARLQKECALRDAYSTLEIKSLKGQIDSLVSNISMKCARAIVSAVECATEIASMARDVLDENDALFKKVIASPGLMVFRRVKDERDGLVQLVGTMTDELNGLAAVVETTTAQRNSLAKRVERMHRRNACLLTKVDALDTELRRLKACE